MKSNNDLKKILEESLKPLRKDVNGIKKDLDGVKNELRGVKKDLSVVKEDLGEVKTTQKDHTSRLEALSGDMEQVLSEVKATHDEIGLWHQRDKREIDEIKKSLNLPIMPDMPA